MQRDCRIDRINPSCYSPKALVLREGPSSRLEISLRHSWKRFNVGNKMFATTMLVQRNRSRCWMLTDGLCTTGVRRWRVLRVCVAPALELTLTRNMCQLHRPCGKLEADLRNYGTPHWWRTMKLFRIETCVPLGLTSHGRCCGTGMITTKIMESALIQMRLPPTAMLIRSRPFPLGMGVCWPWAPKKVQWQGCCSKKAVTLWWWQETSKQSFAMVCRRAPLGKIWSRFLCSLQCKSGRKLGCSRKLLCMKVLSQKPSMSVWIARSAGTAHIGLDVRCGGRKVMGLNRFRLELSRRLQALWRLAKTLWMFLLELRQVPKGLNRLWPGLSGCLLQAWWIQSSRFFSLALRSEVWKKRQRPLSAPWKHLVQVKSCCWSARMRQLRVYWIVLKHACDRMIFLRWPLPALHWSQPHRCMLRCWRRLMKMWKIWGPGFWRHQKPLKHFRVVELTEFSSSCWTWWSWQRSSAEWSTGTLAISTLLKIRLGW